MYRVESWYEGSEETIHDVDSVEDAARSWMDLHENRHETYAVVNVTDPDGTVHLVSVTNRGKVEPY